MIHSTTSSDRTSQANAIQPPQAGSAASSTKIPADQVSTEQATYLREALSRQPEVRPDVVARGKELLADPSYPSTGIVKSVASQILNSPDLSEDES